MWLSSLETGSACGNKEGVTGAGERMIRQEKKGTYVCLSSQAKLDLACNHARCNTFSDKSIHHGMWSNKHMHVINICAPADKH